MRTFLWPHDADSALSRRLCQAPAISNARRWTSRPYRAGVRFDLFSSGRLYKALEKAEYPDLPALRTLQDWIKNDSAPEGARRAVAELLGTTKEAPRPEWAEGLEARIAQEVVNLLASPEQVEAAIAGVEHLAELQRQLDGQHDGETEPQDQVGSKP